MQTCSPSLFQGAPGVGEAVDAFFGAAKTGMDGVLEGFKVGRLHAYTCVTLSLTGLLGSSEDWLEDHPRRYLRR